MGEELENWETVVAQATERVSQKGGGCYQYKYWREDQVLRTSYWI